MKTLQDIKKGFETFDMAKVVVSGECEDNGLKYYIQDYSDFTTESCTYVGRISRYNHGYEMGVKWYSCNTKFDNAIKRILKKQ